MEIIQNFLSNPYVCLISFILTVIASIIAIWQAFEKSKALRELNELKVSINHSEHKVEQGDRSQHIGENHGNLTIDNRG